MNKKNPVATARYALYERAVQHPNMQASFLAAMLAEGIEAPVLGEDFSGTGAVSRAWVDRHPKARAVCVDRDAEPLARLKNKERVAALCCDVLEVRDKADVLAVLNFSICEWHTRDALVVYLKHAGQRLRAGGVLVLDIYGGQDAFAIGTSELELQPSEDSASREDAVVYQWEQRSADPLSGRVHNAMHFRFADGSWLREAFVYDWRLWSLPELIDALADAGFGTVDVHDRFGDAIDEAGDVYPSPIEEGSELEDNYVVYLVAREFLGARR